MKCPKCGASMREKNGRYGQFLGCSNWPRCNGTRDVNPTDNSTPTKPTKPTRRKSRAESHTPGDNQLRLSTKTTTTAPIEDLPS